MFEKQMFELHILIWLTFYTPRTVCPTNRGLPGWRAGGRREEELLPEEGTLAALRILTVP